MNGEILVHGSPLAVRTYMLSKLKLWTSWRYSKSERIKKSLLYYETASIPNREVIKSAYVFVCKEGWPNEAQKNFEKLLQAKVDKSHKMSRGDAIELKQNKIARLQRTIQQLETWEKNGDYQLGEDFFLELRSLVEPVLSGTFDLMTFEQENKLRTGVELTHSGSMGKGKLNGEFAFMAGMHAKSTSDFKFDSNLLRGAAALELEMRAGTWGSGSVAAKIGKNGLTAEAAVALALGMECKIDAKSTWNVGDFGMSLDGSARVFLGAEGELGAKLKLDKSGFQASLKASAFAGIKAECKGGFAFKYLGEDMFAADASAYVSLGVGGEFEASIKSSLFGATEIKFKAAATLGFGSGAETATKINFTRIGLAGASQFRKLVYLPTVLQGYKTDLTDYDKMNTHYLNKSLAKLKEELESQRSSLKSLNKVPVEKQSLLLGMDDD